MPGHCELPRRECGTRPEHQSPINSVAASLQRFTGNPSPLVSGAPWWDTSGALAYKALQADAVDRRRLSEPSGPVRLITTSRHMDVNCQGAMRNRQSCR